MAPVAELAERFKFLSVYHFDPYSIALTKLTRLETRDVVDVSNMVEAGVINCDDLERHFESAFARFPQASNRSDRDDFRRKVDAFRRQHCE